MERAGDGEIETAMEEEKQIKEEEKRGVWCRQCACWVNYTSFPSHFLLIFFFPVNEKKMKRSWTGFFFSWWKKEIYNYSDTLSVEICWNSHHLKEIMTLHVPVVISISSSYKIQQDPVFRTIWMCFWTRNPVSVSHNKYILGICCWWLSPVNIWISLEKPQKLHRVSVDMPQRSPSPRSLTYKHNCILAWSRRDVCNLWL